MQIRNIFLQIMHTLQHLLRSILSNSQITCSVDFRVISTTIRNHIICSESIKQAIWYQNIGFCLFSIDPKKEKKEMPDEFQKSIFNYCQGKIIATQMYCNMTRTIVEKIVPNSSTSNLISGKVDTSLSNASMCLLS